MRVLDYLRRKTKKIHDWDDFHFFETELIQKIREFYPEPKYHFVGDEIGIGVMMNTRTGEPRGIAIHLTYYDNKSSADDPIECQYVYRFRFNKTFTSMIKRYDELYETFNGEYEIYTAVRDEILNCKGMSDLKNINVLDVIGFGAKCVITSVDLVLDEDEFPELIPEGVIIRWKSVLGYYCNPAKIIITDLPEGVIRDWNTIDSIKKRNRLYKYEEEDWDGCYRLCYSVEDDTDDEKEWVYR